MPKAGKPKSILFLLALLAISHKSQAADDRVRNYISPDGKARLSVVSVGNDDAPEFDLRLSREGQPPATIDTFMRSIDVYWSPDSTYVAVTDWIGSNVADCYVVAVTDPKLRFSVTDAIPKLPIDIQNSHYYVSCNGWQDSGHLWVMASGHTDYPPFHDFRYEFNYNVATHRIP